jgi:hypothetical protein
VVPATVGPELAQFDGKASREALLVSIKVSTGSGNQLKHTVACWEPQCDSNWDVDVRCNGSLRSFREELGSGLGVTPLIDGGVGKSRAWVRPGMAKSVGWGPICIRPYWI